MNTLEPGEAKKPKRAGGAKKVRSQEARKSTSQEAKKSSKREAKQLEPGTHLEQHVL